MSEDNIQADRPVVVEFNDPSHPMDGKWVPADDYHKLERELADSTDRIRRLIAERDSARMDAERKHVLRDDFAAELGVENGSADCVERGLAAIRKMKAELAEAKAERAGIDATSDSETAQQALSDLHVAQGMLLECRSQLTAAQQQSEKWEKVADALINALVETESDMIAPLAAYDAAKEGK